MSARLARESLVVVIGGDEVPGITIYGLAGPGGSRRAVIPADAWIGEPIVDEFTLRGDSWEIVTWDVPILVWPTVDEMRTAVRVSLAAMVDAGCSISWIGAEGLPFCDPPRLFDPDCMSGGVLAWMTGQRQFDCSLNPNEPITPISDQHLLMLRQYARGLADAT
jgi:hypothetical protein